jgi:hypothetical protein
MKKPTRLKRIKVRIKNKDLDVQSIDLIGTYRGGEVLISGRRSQQGHWKFWVWR